MNLPKTEQELELWYNLIDLYELKKKNEDSRSKYIPYYGEFEMEYKETLSDYLKLANEL